jgi:hypothetical protein
VRSQHSRVPLFSVIFFIISRSIRVSHTRSWFVTEAVAFCTEWSIPGYPTATYALKCRSTSSVPSADSIDKQVTCADVGKHDCADLDIGCMCKDDAYVYAGLCCVNKACGAVALSYAKDYVERYCDDWNTDPPSMDDLRCATITTSSQSTASATTAATSTTTERASETSQTTDNTNDGGSGGTNVGMIAGIAGGVVALILAIAIAWFFWWRKRKNQKPAVQPQVAATADASKLTESTEMPELYSNPATSAPSLPPRSQAGYQGYYANMATPPAYAAQPAHPGGTSDYYSTGSELGTDGGRPYGSELHGRDVRPELQGMSFATSNQFPAELSSNHGKYYY